MLEQVIPPGAAPSSKVSAAGSAAVERYANNLLREARQAGRRRLAEARNLASVLKLLDGTTAVEILRSVRDANQRDLERVQAVAGSLLALAGSKPAAVPGARTLAPAPRRPRTSPAGPRAPRPRPPGPREHLTALLDSSRALVERSERQAEQHLAGAAQLAGLLRPVDAGCAERVLAAARATAAAQVEEARVQAREIGVAAQARGLSLVDGYMRMLVADAEQAAERRLPRTEEVAALLEPSDPEAATRLRELVRVAETARLGETQRQAHAIRSRNSELRGKRASPSSG